ncbi:TonB-dependent receptor [Pseudoxanthomonas suwonensis 11-1]|uniref:TonB-dependent receptor n=1 Tax=Pseudoxanthomonas suwonensis (strain 11-1) TaxID=743721 RepID=E6WQL4_PSEUU|nr:TonB-dependent receptor [Pseudoxanthomonas suwonensis]ADV26463.1 TonB-dependent receptor [Pseudoxanthomonas suwonensis 11-1]
MNHKMKKKFRSRAMFTIVGGMIVINPAFAQDSQEATQLDTVQVTGLRSSLDQAMNIKRDTPGVVDAISAEDIGKFPDTNLAESLQRITGISIERRDGEGAQVTARGFGPGYNLVTLNGRQIPGADGFGGGGLEVGGVGSGTRGFNFAQLASEAVNGVTVYKTGRASQPSGGIGATVDILTARPFNNRGGEVVASAGVKAVSDDSQTIGSDITPEISGIFSYANPDKTWGFSVNASYQERHGGSAQATQNGWNVARWTGTDSKFRSDAVIENAPEIGQLYSMPNDVRYAYQNFERERTNAQAVLQFAPSDALTFTLDYTYSVNEIAQDRGEQTMWLQNNLTHVTFDGDKKVATPVYIRDLAGGGKDFGFEQQRDEQKFNLDSLGLNVKWDVNDRLTLNFDVHNTKVNSRPNDPVTGGSSTAFSFGAFAPNPAVNNWTQEYEFNNGLPLMWRTLYPTTADALAGTNGVVNSDFSPETFGSQIMRIWSTRQDSEVKAGRIDGEFAFDNGRFLFGVDSSDSKMRRLNVDGHAHLMTLGDWNSTDRGQIADIANHLRQFSITKLFEDFNTRGADSNVWIGNATELAQWAEGLCASGNAPAAWDAQNRCDEISSRVYGALDADNLVQEKTKSVYIQWEQDGMLGDFPTYMVAGVRYEKTDVKSTSVIQVPGAMAWLSNNDFQIRNSDEAMPFSETASYSYVLPNLDFSIDFTSDLKGRASFSKTIARAPYGNLYAGPGAGIPSGSTLYGEQFRATGNAQTPSLLPLESDNIDIGLEWYFAPSSFVGVTYWNKRVKNFIGNTVVRENLYGLADPTTGPDAQAANAFLASAQCTAQVTAAGNDPSEGCKQDYTTLFAATALIRYAAQTGGLAAYDGSNQQSLDLEALYDIIGDTSRGDPLYQFDVNRPVNQRAATLHGWELGGQYFFGDTGFGVLANYTIVKGDVGVDRAADPDTDVFALTGLSDTANLVLMYEKFGWSARLAWNWRDEYLLAANQNGNNRNPYFVEEYDQIDLSVSYKLTDNLSLSAEAINLTGEDVRWHARSSRQFVRVVDQSPRYMVGLRYTF